MNTESVDLKRVKIPILAGVGTKPGDFAWDFDCEETRGDRDRATHHIYLHLPGVESWSAIQVKRVAPGGNRVWGWDGNEDKPTLTPSIHHIGVWHGYLRAGRLVSC